MQRSKRASILGLVLLVIMASTVLGAYVAYYSMTTPGQITINVNAYKLQIFEDEGLTIVATSIDFPDLMESDLSGATASNSSLYYLHASESDIVSVIWNVTGLDPLFTINGFWITTLSQTVMNWDQNTVAYLDLGNSQTLVCMWELDVDDKEAGSYSFDFNFYAGEST